MANFKIAYEKLLKWEGGHSNHKHDTGGQTYAGVSRNNWPNWPGWKVIDSGILSDTLPALVRDFYREEFWEKIRGCEIGSQAVADVLFSTAVNAGVVSAVRRLQTLVGAKADGALGPITLAAINRHSGAALANRYCASVREFYHAIVRRDPSQKVFLAGWINRINSYEVTA